MPEKPLQMAPKRVQPPQSTRHVSAKAFELDVGRAKNYHNILSKLGYKNDRAKPPIQKQSDNSTQDTDWKKVERTHLEKRLAELRNKELQLTNGLNSATKYTTGPKMTAGAS